VRKTLPLEHFFFDYLICFGFRASDSNLGSKTPFMTDTFFDVSPGIVAHQSRMPSSSVKRLRWGCGRFWRRRSCFLGVLFTSYTSAACAGLRLFEREPRPQMVYGVRDTPCSSGSFTMA